MKGKRKNVYRHTAAQLREEQQVNADHEKAFNVLQAKYELALDVVQFLLSGRPIFGKNTLEVLLRYAQTRAGLSRDFPAPSTDSLGRAWLEKQVLAGTRAALDTEKMLTDLEVPA